MENKQKSNYPKKGVYVFPYFHLLKSGLIDMKKYFITIRTQKPIPVT